MHGRKFVAGVIMAALSLTVLGSGVGHASGPKAPLTGAGVFQCATSLFFGSGLESQESTPCIGTVSGADLSIFTGRPYATLNVCALCTLRVDYNYKESCAAPNLPSLTGTAEGEADITPATLADVSVKVALPTDAKGPVTTGTSVMDIPFSWLRVGGVALVLTGNLAQPAGPQKWNDGNNKKKKTFTSTSGTVTKQKKDTVGGIGVAAFGANPLPCPDPNKAVNVAGVLLNLA